MRRSVHVRHRLDVLAATAITSLALLLSGGCSDGSTSVGTASAPNASAAVALPADAYRASLDILVQVSNPPDPQDARLRLAFSGSALANAQTTVGRLANDGLARRGSYDVADLRVVDLQPTSATLEACVVDRTEEFRRVDGTVVRPAPGAPNSITVRMLLGAGRWTVDELSPGPGC